MNIKIPVVELGKKEGMIWGEEVLTVFKVGFKDCEPQVLEFL